MNKRSGNGAYHKVPTILQMENTECGAASLAMILSSFGRSIPLEQLRVETGVTRDGSNAANLRRCAKSYGLDCKAKRREADQLRTLPMPCILYWQGDHFLVLEGFRGRYAVLNDPACGRRRVTMEELRSSFSGIVLTFAPTDAFEKQKKQHRTAAFLAGILREQLPLLLKTSYAGLLMVFPGVLIPVLSQAFIDDVLAAGIQDRLPQLLLFLGFSILLMQGLEVFRTRLLSRLRAKLTLTGSQRMLRQLFRLPMTFFDQRGAADLVGRMDHHEEISSFLTAGLAEALFGILFALCCFIVLCCYSLPLALAALAAAALPPLCILLTERRTTTEAMRLQISDANLYSAVCGGAAISQSIKAAGAETAYSNRLLGLHAIRSSQEQRVRLRRSVLAAIPDAVQQLVRVLILLLGAMLVIQGRFSAGMLVAFQVLFDSLTRQATALTAFFSKLQRLRAGILRVDDVDRYPPQPEPAPDAETRLRLKGKLSGRVVLDEVTYGYSAMLAPVISDLSITIPSGASVAFAGPSGCGKSTLVKVISGLYTPQRGKVLLDGYPIDALPPQILHASVATVSQNITLFSGSIRDNLTMWNPAVLESDMIAAARDACIHDDIIQRPGGYDYILQEGGANLSGGQRQRLEIARALTANPSILIMDEATSALDPPTEKQVMDNIRRRGCTCIVIAHRLSAVRDCSQIVVMQDGAMVQQGTHQELMAQEGLYRELCLQESTGAKEYADHV